MTPMDPNLIASTVREWIGTPYRHQASCKHVGTDCLGLVRGVWRDCLGAEPETPPAYTMAWAETGKEEVLWQAAKRHLIPVKGPLAVGQVILFRMRAAGVAKHLGIITQIKDGPAFVHAYSGHHVVEASLTANWNRRIVAQFYFPKGFK